MLTDTLAGLLLLLTGALAGVLLAVEVAVVPMLGRLPGDRYREVHRLLDPRFDPLMPTVNKVALVAGLVLTVYGPGTDTRIAYAVTEAGLVGVALVSELSNVRMNRTIDTWEAGRLPGSWTATRERWARANRYRTWLALTAFGAAIVGVTLR